MLMRIGAIIAVIGLFPAAGLAQTKEPKIKYHLASPQEMQERRDAQKLLDNEWYRGNRIFVRNQMDNHEGSYSLVIFDHQSTLITTSDEEAPNGQIMLVGGRWMLTKDLKMPAGYEIDYLDGPILIVRLALRLLSKVAPDGPSRITEKTAFKIKESKRLLVATESADLSLDPTWRMEAALEPAGPDKWSFDLSVKEPHHKFRLSGTWQKDPIQPVLSDDTPIDGWELYELGQTTTQHNGSAMYDYRATPSDLHPQTIGELRRLVKETTTPQPQK